MIDGECDGMGGGERGREKKGKEGRRVVSHGWWWVGGGGNGWRGKKKIGES